MVPENSVIYWLEFVEHELLLFAGVFFLIGAIDEIGVDLAYVWLRLTGRVRTPSANSDDLIGHRLAGRAAVFIAAWDESHVIEHTLRHALDSWRDPALRIYVGCYRNDAATLMAAQAGCGSDGRVRLVIHDRDGPTSKADCLNRLYQAMEDDERRLGERFRMVVLHDAEDLVDPCALPLLDMAIARADFVQLPVMALPQQSSPFIGSHYSDEFAEAHGKALVVRDALCGGIPGAGVGSAFSRDILTRLSSDVAGQSRAAQVGADMGPFPAKALTEDYELGLRVKILGGRSRFLRARTDDGRLIATRAYFPDTLPTAVRQKTRWVHGISLQGWDRIGWSGGVLDVWMQLRDRRGPFAAGLLALAYALLVLSGGAMLAAWAGLFEPTPIAPALYWLLMANLVALGWRIAMRAAFTAREYGWRQGLLAMPRLMVANIIAIMAGRRAIMAYAHSLAGRPVIWDKTSHIHRPFAIQDHRRIA